MHSGMKRNAQWLLLAVIFFACVKSVIMLVLRGIYFLGGAHTSDTQLFWTIGRAILNGFTPYIHIYENKPPGIFLLSAASLRLFDDGTLGFLLTKLHEHCIPFIRSYHIQFNVNLQQQF